MLVQKHLFHTSRLSLDIATPIAATIGYETYGRLSPARDNAVLICPAFDGSGHAAGKYSEDDMEAGWWDGLIGPGKAFDTDRFFVIAVDGLAALPVRNPMIVTTGPASVNPETGRPFGAAFPQITMRDNVRLQQLLLQSLGIEQLVCVAGAGTGGFQALEWAVTYPDAVQKAVVVASAPQAPGLFALSVCQVGIDTIHADPAYAGGHYYDGPGPKEGLRRAAFLLATLSRSDQWIGAMWDRKTAAGSMHPRSDPDGRFAFQAEMEGIAEVLARPWDAGHFVYTARAALLHDVGYGNRGLEVAAQKLKADLLLVPLTGDRLFPPELSYQWAELVNQYGGKAQVAPVESSAGHVAATAECSRFAEAITGFLRRDGMH